MNLESKSETTKKRQVNATYSTNASLDSDMKGQKSRESTRENNRARQIIGRRTRTCHRRFRYVELVEGEFFEIYDSLSHMA